MDSVEFHREPPSHLPTMVVAFGGWIDAGEAVTGAMRHLVRHLSASHLASIDPEEFFDFTKVRPVVRIAADGQRAIRWPNAKRGATAAPPPRQSARKSAGMHDPRTGAGGRALATGGYARPFNTRRGGSSLWANRGSN